MSSFIETYRRIQFATNTRTQAELASILGIRQSSIADAKRRNVIPAGWYITLFEKFGLSQDWLSYNTGPMYLRREGSDALPERPLENAKEDLGRYSDPAARGTRVTVYSMGRLSSGTGRVPALEAAGTLVLPSCFAGPEMLVLRMHDDNMAPTVRRGAYFGVDTTDIRPLPGGIFVLKCEQVGLLVRRIFLDSNGTQCFLLRSDDGESPESTVSLGKVTEHIIGRVSWVMQAVA
ncbi:MAG: helix-turn-helix domain-containing protein [Betaproteobacteria bacterium]|nr:helix-turn-helix domain-containing protein [Betaproteobacteria bacterium]